MVNISCFRSVVLLQFVQIFGDVDGDTLFVSLADIDGVAVLKPSQLLKRLALLERCLFQFHNLFQYFAAESVNANMFVIWLAAKPHLFGDAAEVGDGLAAEVKRVAA